MRHALILFLALSPWLVHAQGQDAEAATALGFTRSMSIPLNAVQFFDRASEAWTWTFGKEPGARLLGADRTAGILEGAVRLNFRSTMLTGREESMGTVTYHVRLQVHAGECRAVVSGLSHTGNRTTRTGGIHLGTIMRNDADVAQVGGTGRNNLVRLHAEVREAATTRINSLLQAMEARIRASMEP